MTALARPFVVGSAVFGPASSSISSPGRRALRSYALVQDAAYKLDDGAVTGSGIKALCHAAATELALLIGPERAGEFFDLIARQAREVREPDSAT